MSRQSDRAQRAKRSRRDFIKSSLLAAGGAVGPLSLVRSAHALGSDTLRVGLIGCGRRGIAAAGQALSTAGGEVRLAALGDVFPDRIHAAYRSLKSQHGERADVPRDHRFAGMEASANVLQGDVDLVILATPPSFRPQHFEAAVRAGKHVFLERPVAVDAIGVRRVLAAADLADQQGLTAAVGLHRRFEPAYQETLEQLQAGAIGDMVLMRAYWTAGRIRLQERSAGQSEPHFQLRNWRNFAWLSGDPFVEQHVQNLDVINWLKGTHPAVAQGQGGRAQTSGQFFDHHFVEFTYPDGTTLLSQCRRIDGCWNSVAEHAHGTTGRADITGGKIYDNTGQLLWRTQAERDGHRRQMEALIAGIRRGEPIQNVEQGALSTLTAILGRQATYTGQLVTWHEALAAQQPLTDFPG